MNPRDFAERALLGTLLAEPGRIHKLDWLSAEDFYTPAHQTLYRHLADLVAEAQTRNFQAYEATRDDRLEVEFTDGGVAYSAIDYTTQEGEVVRRSASDRQELQDRFNAERAMLDDYSSVTPMAVLHRIQQVGGLGTAQSSVLTGPGLHTLMATAPAAEHAQPQAYGLMVLEASIRRAVEQDGIRVGQLSENSTELTGTLRVVEAALDGVAAAQHRWETATDPFYGRFTFPGRSDERVRTGEPGEEIREAPDPATVAQAERGLLAHALTPHAQHDPLFDRVLPEDFADAQLGTTYRAARTVAVTRGVTVDAVTVAWEQQRQAPQHGDGVPVDQLATLTQQAPHGDRAYHAEIVLRGSLARLTQQAADTVREAAQHPGLVPTDVLHTTRQAYTAVTTAAARMTPTQQGSIAARLAGTAEATPITHALADQKSSSPTARTSAQTREHEADRSR